MTQLGIRSWIPTLLSLRTNFIMNPFYYFSHTHTPTPNPRPGTACFESSSYTNLNLTQPTNYTLPTWGEELTHWERPWCWKDWEQEEKWATEDEVVGWHHRLNGHEFEQTPGDGEGQGSLACCQAHEVTKSWTWLSNWTMTIHKALSLLEEQ